MRIIKSFFEFIVGIVKERKVLIELAKNDFKAKHTNS